MERMELQQCSLDEVDFTSAFKCGPLRVDEGCGLQSPVQRFCEDMLR